MEGYRMMIELSTKLVGYRNVSLLPDGRTPKQLMDSYQKIIFLIRRYC